jgi:hypothetical protein
MTDFDEECAANIQRAVPMGRDARQALNVLQTSQKTWPSVFDVPFPNSSIRMSDLFVAVDRARDI